MRTNPRNYRRRQYDGGKDATVEAKPSSSLYSSACEERSNPRKIDGKDATVEAKPPSSLYSSACGEGSNPRKIYGKDATVEANSSSSLYSSTCIFLMDEDGEENGVLPVTITYEKCIHGCSHELYSFNKEQYPAYPAAVSNVLPQAGSSGLIKPPQDQEQEQLSLMDVINQDSDFDFDEKEKQPEDEFLAAPAPDAYLSPRMIEEEQPEDEFLSAPAPDAYRFHGVIFNGMRMRRVGRRFGRGWVTETYSVGNEKPPPLESRKRYFYEDDEDLEELVHKKRLLERKYQGSHWTVSSDGIGVPLHPNQQPLPQMYEYHTGMPLGSVPNVSVPSTSGPATILDTNPMSLLQQAELAKKELLYELGFFLLINMLPSLGESHTNTFAYLTAPLLSLAAREGSLSVPVDKFVFMRKCRDSTFIIRDFLQEKLSLIEEIEVQIKEFDEKHASAILERRTANDNDEMVELGAAVEAAMAVLNKQGNSNSAFAAATSAVLAVSAFIRQQIDEFGRDKNLQARQKRRARFENKRASAKGIDGSSLEIEGESSTDESGSETSAYKETRDGLLQSADKVFSDASEVYSRLSRVRTRFMRWKRDNSSTYRDAYMYLNVPSIFSPYVRLELLKWDPLHQDVDFCDMKWHGLLFDNGKPEDGDDFAPDDTDANLVSELVEKVVIPILHHRIVRCWDILSTRETRNAVAATSLVKGYVSGSSEALAELFAAVRARLVEGITAISVPTWDPLVLKAVPNAPQFVAYRFGTSVRLMRNICMWKGILALPVLENLALSDLLFGKVLPHVRGIASKSNIHDAVTRTERIVASLSGVWTGPRTHSHPLQPLVDSTLTLGRILEKRLASGLDDAETIGLARRLKRILVQIHEHEHARAIVRTFNLKEAL